MARLGRRVPNTPHLYGPTSTQIVASPPPTAAGTARGVCGATGRVAASAQSGPVLHVKKNSSTVISWTITLSNGATYTGPLTGTVVIVDDIP